MALGRGPAWLPGRADRFSPQRATGGRAGPPEAAELLALTRPAFTTPSKRPTSTEQSALRGHC